MDTVTTTTVLYPYTDGKKFDMQYYMEKHLPLAEKVWGPLGMRDWTVVKFKDDDNGNKPMYRLKTVSHWTHLAAMKHAASSAEGKPVLDDAQNFTDEIPVLLVGFEKRSSTVA